MTAMKNACGFLLSAGYTLAFQAQGWLTEVYGCVPAPGHEAILEGSPWQSELAEPGGREILRHIPQTDALSGLNHSSFATAAVHSTSYSRRNLLFGLGFSRVASFALANHIRMFPVAALHHTYWSNTCDLGICRH